MEPQVIPLGFEPKTHSLEGYPSKKRYPLKDSELR